MSQGVPISPVHARSSVEKADSPAQESTSAVSEARVARKTEPGRSVRYVVLTGNPNCGKTTIFNALTGLRAKVGNYAGVTVERKEGKLLGIAASLNARAIDLPGTYSLSPQSLDEQISRDVLLNRLPELPAPSLAVIVVDASNLERNLYFTSQVIELGHPTVVALNMMDVAEAQGHVVDANRLASELGVPVMPVVGSTGKGVPELRSQIAAMLSTPKSPPLKSFCDLPEPIESELEALLPLFGTFTEPGRNRLARAEALLALCSETGPDLLEQRARGEIEPVVGAARARLQEKGIDWRSAAIEGRYARISALHKATVEERMLSEETFSDRLDRVLTHKVWGTLIFLAAMALMFQSIFTFARIPMDALQGAMNWAGGEVGRLIPPGDLNSLLVDGVIAGVGAVVVFLPQILLLFLFIGFLEDTGYMARAAFLMDRLMSKVGLHGKSFIPMLSSFACAIPGIMSTRTIESPKDRLVTILVSPLMSCSARLPVYTLLIAACIPNKTVFGFFKLQGLTMLSMYVLGVVGALTMAWLFKKTILRGETPLLILELPPYKRPLASVVLRHMWDRASLFLRNAGTIILGINIVLWFLASYPRGSPSSDNGVAASNGPATAVLQDPAPGADAPSAVANQDASARLRGSFAGRMGRLIEPIISPLGFDWKIGIGIISSFAAREVFVSTISTVYNVETKDKSQSGMANLAKTLRDQKRADGTPVYTIATAISLMVFYVFALQCVSTTAVVRRETNSWKWPLFQWVYMGILAWMTAFVAYRGAIFLGLG